MKSGIDVSAKLPAGAGYDTEWEHSANKGRGVRSYSGSVQGLSSLLHAHWDITQVLRCCNAVFGWRLTCLQVKLQAGSPPSGTCLKAPKRSVCHIPACFRGLERHDSHWLVVRLYSHPGCMAMLLHDAVIRCWNEGKS